MKFVLLFIVWALVAKAFRPLKPTGAATLRHHVLMAATEPTKEELIEAVSTKIPKGSTVVIKYGI